jgi:hypothetical protein
MRFYKEKKMDLFSDLLGWLMAAFFIIAAVGIFIAIPIWWLLALMFGW